MESICYVCSKQNGLQAQQEAFGDICQGPLSYVLTNQADKPADYVSLIKAITMLTGAVKACGDMEEQNAA